MRPETSEFIKLAANRVKFGLFLFYRLPSAYFSGVRVREMNAQKCITSVPFKWLTQNPFKSTYFASLSMAAELSTGLLAMAHVYKRQPSVSMLVIKTEANYYKKATGRTYFTCADGDGMKVMIEKAVHSGEPQSFTAKSTGKNDKGELVAEFLITWSFRQKQPNSK